MSAVSRAFSEVPTRRGLVIGIIPGATQWEASEPRPGYPNPWVEMAVFTHLQMSGRDGMDPMSRNHLNVLSSNVLVALPGGSGTASEVSLALRYGRPVIAYLRSRDEIPDLPAAVRAEGDLEKIKEFVREKIGRAERHPGNGRPSPVE
jgi:predicted Rossmann-fold nucleotide-binding protein